MSIFTNFTGYFTELTENGLTLADVIFPLRNLLGKRTRLYDLKNLYVNSSKEYSGDICNDSNDKEIKINEDVSLSGSFYHLLDIMDNFGSGIDNIPFIEDDESIEGDKCYVASNSRKNIKAKPIINNVEIIDNLDSEDGSKPLSASQGYLLFKKYDLLLQNPTNKMPIIQFEEVGNRLVLCKFFIFPRTDNGEEYVDVFNTGTWSGNYSILADGKVAYSKDFSKREPLQVVDLYNVLAPNTTIVINISVVYRSINGISKTKQAYYRVYPNSMPMTLNDVVNEMATNTDYRTLIKEKVTENALSMVTSPQMY